MSIYINTLFIFKCFCDQQHLQYCEKALQLYQTRKLHIVLLSSSFSFRQQVQSWRDHSQWFLHKTVAFHAEHYTTPLLFHSFQVSWGTWNWTPKNYGFICDAIFFTFLHKAVIAPKCIINTQDCWIRNMVSVVGESMNRNKSQSSVHGCFANPR